ncbi:MAG: NUDIX hydrolase [Saprospiraceae bacterium]|nr:NUDIX hydrolase [Saprospiraceae bacterium]
MKIDESKNPWQTLKIKEVYDNPWIQVSHRDVINPSGGSGIYGWVHFKNLAIGIIPLDKDYNTWLVGQYRYTMGEYSWEIVEGGGPLNEPALNSAEKELKEETGIIAKNWLKIGELTTSNSVTDERAIMYVARDLTFGTPEPEETEQLVVKKIPFQKAVEMVMDGSITDALSVAAILKTKILIEKGEI